MGCSCAEIKNEKVFICFDNDGYEVVGVYSDKSDAQKHMIKAYVEELRERNDRCDIDFNDVAYDLETMLNGYIEGLFYVEEHEVKTSFEQ